MSNTKHGHTWWHKRLDKKFGDWLRETFSECAMCNRPGYMTVSHIKPKGTYPHLRYDPINVLPMDGRCHQFVWHSNPTESGRWFEAQYPQRSAYLEEAKLLTIKRTEEYYQKVEEAIDTRNIKALMVLQTGA